MREAPLGRAANSHGCVRWWSTVAASGGRRDGLPCRRSRVRVPSSALYEPLANAGVSSSQKRTRQAAWQQNGNAQRGSSGGARRRPRRAPESLQSDPRRRARLRRPARRRHAGARHAVSRCRGSGESPPGFPTALLPSPCHSAILTLPRVLSRDAAMRRCSAKRLAGAKALQANQRPKPRWSARGPVIVSFRIRIAPPSSARPR